MSPWLASQAIVLGAVDRLERHSINLPVFIVVGSFRHLVFELTQRSCSPSTACLVPAVIVLGPGVCSWRMTALMWLSRCPTIGRWWLEFGRSWRGCLCLEICWTQCRATSSSLGFRIQSFQLCCSKSAPGTCRDWRRMSLVRSWTLCRWSRRQSACCGTYHCLWCTFWKASQSFW